MYEYAGSNPVSFDDPFGLECVQVGNCLQGEKGVQHARFEAMRRSDRIEPTIVDPSLLFGGFGRAGGGAISRALSRGVARGAAREATVTAARSVEHVASNELVMTHGRTMSRKALARLTDDIEKNGVRDALSYVQHNGTKYLVDGHHRLLAARKLGLETVPAQQVSLPFRGYRTVSDLFTGP